MFGEKRSVPIKSGGSDYHLTVGSSGWLSLSNDYLPAEKALRNSDIWTAVITIASDIARTSFHSSKRAEEKTLSNPATLTNRFNFYQSMAMQMLLDGNAYAIRRVGDERAGEWWEFVPPSGVTVWLSDNGQSLSYDFNFLNPSEKRIEKISASDVIHWRWASENGGIVGQSPLVSLINEYNLQQSANNLAMSTMKRAITPTSILKSTAAKLGKKEREEVRSVFEEANTGNNSGRVLVLDPLFDYNQVEVKADIAKILDSVDYTRSQIAKAFMIPMALLGDEAEHSNPDQIKKQYDQAFDRYLQAVVGELSAKLSGNISTDIHLINDFDSSGLEGRVIALAGSGIINTTQAMSILKKSSSDIVTSDMLQGELDADDAEDVAENASEIIGKGLNGAQTQSLITIIVQYQNKVLTESQAAQMMIVSLGITEEQAKRILGDSDISDVASDFQEETNEESGT
jgi:HK97 family phage portal protein